MDRVGEYCKCPECGLKVRNRRDCGKLVHRCQQGAGDWVENWLASWGMTKDKYVELKKEIGLPPTCNCDGRQEWLNKAGALLGIAADRYGPNRKKNNGS